MLAQPAILQKQIWIGSDDGQRSLPVEAEEMRRALKGWRTVSDVARAFAGWYNGNDVRRFVSYLARQYRQEELLPPYKESISSDEEKLYFKIMVWLNWRILRGQYDDALGELYMAVGYPNRDAGQFFTPYDLSRLIAEMQLPENRREAEAIARGNPEGKITIYDPACGSGSMLCAAWEVAVERGYDDLVQFYGQDLDPYCVVMARVNLIMRRELSAVRRAANTTQATIQALEVLAARRDE
jgi:hypothetical protein